MAATTGAAGVELRNWLQKGLVETTKQLLNIGPIRSTVSVPASAVAVAAAAAPTDATVAAVAATAAAAELRNMLL